MAANTGANSCDMVPFVAISASVGGGEEGQKRGRLAPHEVCKLLLGYQSRPSTSLRVYCVTGEIQVVDLVRRLFVWGGLLMA